MFVGADSLQPSIQRMTYSSSDVVRRPVIKPEKLKEILINRSTSFVNRRDWDRRLARLFTVFKAIGPRC